MVYNILNGDALAYSFPGAKVEGDSIVFREGLMDGDLSGNDLQHFWQARAAFHETTQAAYDDKVVGEINKIIAAATGSEFNLWFEYDLFCQVNMWFIISIIRGLLVKTKVYAVYTVYLDKKNKHFWNGFGPADSAQLRICYAGRILLNDADLQLGQALWDAYRDNNLAQLRLLASSQSAAFPYLQEVVQAHIDRFATHGEYGRPEMVIQDIANSLTTNFQELCAEFWKRESIYGFGDTQLKRLYDKVMQDRQ